MYTYIHIYIWIFDMYIYIPDIHSDICLSIYTYMCVCVFAMQNPQTSQQPKAHCTFGS